MFQPEVLHYELDQLNWTGSCCLTGDHRRSGMVKVASQDFPPNISNSVTVRKVRDNIFLDIVISLYRIKNYARRTQDSAKLNFAPNWIKILRKLAYHPLAV